MHRCLRKVVTGLRGRDSPDNYVVDIPYEGFRRPLYTVGMELSLWRCDVNVFVVVVIGNAFPVVICLDLRSASASHFPVDLVKVIGQ